MMFFSKAARAAAVVVLLLGVLNIFMGVVIAKELLLSYEQALARYTTASSSGEVIDRGIYMIVFAIALGTLAEIGLSARRNGS